MEKVDQIGSDLGNASTVICAISGSGKLVFDLTIPFWIDCEATKDITIDSKKIRPRGYPQITPTIGQIWRKDFALTNNENGDFKYLHVKWGGGGDHCLHTCKYPI